MTKYNIGFTGSRTGMTPLQLSAIQHYFTEMSEEVNEFHHGDCIGADFDAATIVWSVERYIEIVSHPPLSQFYRAWAPAHRSMPAKPYLDRNRDIVDATDILIATPGENEEQVRSGTWSTVRYARSVGKPVHILGVEGEWLS